ncbi:MAG: WXG100 family type VII secretion target [Clostridia bacterium]|nr:WXG100 family type VII secretion target [Clostridia bacterium]
MLWNFAFTSADFKVSTDELKRQSDLVNAGVLSIEKRFGDIERLIRTSNTYWNGEAADQFRSAASGFKDDFREILGRLSEHVGDLRRMAGIYEAAESKANEIIEDLPSDVIL